MYLLLKGIILTISKLLANWSKRGTEKFDDYWEELPKRTSP